MARFIATAKETVPMLLLLLLSTIFVLALGSCARDGGERAGGGDEQTVVEPTTGGETTSAEVAHMSVVELTPSRDSGVRGAATFTDTSGGAEVMLSVQNLQDQPGTVHLAHIHTGGTCADDRAGNPAPVEYPLNVVFTGADGTGTSTTMIPEVTVAELFTGAPKYVHVHARQIGDEPPPGISCGDLAVRGEETTSAMSGEETTSSGGDATNGF